MKIALFGGTFDPVHHGHLIQARDALEELGLDQVIFIPAAISPHKLARRPAPAETRLAMVHAAIRGETGLAVDDLELRRAGPSYAIETAEIYRARYPEAQIFYLLGQDNLSELHTWREIEKLQTLLQFMVLNRGLAVETEFPSVSCRAYDISSTEIRRRVLQERSIQYLVPDEVRDMIRAQNIYKELPL